MRTKNFYLCLLLLVLGTANVWADKYYQPYDYRHENTRYNDLLSMVGQRFMIYNTSFSDGTDLTGFLCDNGTRFTLDKTKERDRFVYNERFVYVLEDYGTADDCAYAIRSVGSGTYVAADGSTGHAAPQPIYIKDWDSAKADGWSLAGVRSETRNFEGINNGSITTAKNQAFLLSSTATHSGDTKYWNGDATSFKIDTKGQPFAFYMLREVTTGDYLTDLHIFSRSDLYSAQVIWGYVQTAGDITVSPDGTGDAAANTSLLIDGDATTSVSTIDGGGEHYIQFSLGNGALTDSLFIHLQRAEDNIPESIKIQSCATADGSYTPVGNTYETGLGANLECTLKVKLTSGHKFIRVVNAASNAKISLSEIAILPCNEKTKQAMNYFNTVKAENNEVYSRASWQQYTKLVDEYNKDFPEAKILSGVPIPGNKYRIYADAYDVTDEVYVNKEICLDATNNNAVLIKDAGSYNALKVAGSATTAYEWYCEQTNDGFIVFRNVANTGLYLANNGEVSATAYKWSFSTVKTSRHGVPLWDKDGKYLTIANNGEDGNNNGWVPDVTSAQDQTGTAGYTYQTAGADTPDDEDDDESETIESGICTDFVFIPVDVTPNEKKITFTANEIVKRNSIFTFDGVEYTLPYSRMFTSKEELDKVSFKLQCPVYHPYSGTYVNKVLDDGSCTDYDSDTGVLKFIYSVVDNEDNTVDVIKDGDVLDIKLEIDPFVPSNEEDGIRLYLIRSISTKSIKQQAPGMRKADTDIDIDGEGPIPTVGAEVYYAKFEGRNKKMSLIPASPTAAHTTFKAASLFYFTKTEDKEADEYWSVNIRSAITTTKCAATNQWDEAGKTWYIQPNAAEGLSGYTIGLNVLNADNNPGGAWRVDNVDGDSIVSDNAEKGSALWYFEEVDASEAEVLLTAYIDSMYTVITGHITEYKTWEGIDNDKADKYQSYADDIKSNSTQDNITVAGLVDISQKLHMLEHEIEYALWALPEFTDHNKIGVDGKFDHPHWYYIYNVRSKYTADGAGVQNEYYAKYINPTTHMALEQVTDADADGKKDFGLEHMFYFEGRKVTEEIGEGTYNAIPDNKLTIDEYLQVDIHNFAQPDSTLVSKNDVLFTKENFYPGKGEQEIVSGLDLKYDETWRIECEYNFYGDKFESFNTYGTTLLSSTDPGLTPYWSEFQVYLQDDQELVVKMNNAYDTYKWDGTVGKCSTIRIVITHTSQSTKFDIYNSEGTLWEDLPEFQEPLNTVTRLTSMLPAEGVKINVLGVERINAYNWRKQQYDAGTVDTKDEIDTWYILPSSNTSYQGFSIVAKGADDKNLGWTNVTASNKEIFSDAGNDDNSTWQFVQIKEFDAHVDELLAKYNASDCVIYNEKLAALFRLLSKNASYIKKVTYDNPIEIDGVEKTDEDFFNEIYEAIKNYDGPMPDELKKPKPGKFYTIRPAYGNSDVRVAVNDWNCLVQREGLIEVVDDKKHYDSHSVWFFEGTADGEYLKRDGNLTLNSLHTQSNTKDFTAEKYMLVDDAAENIVLLPVGGCIVRLNDGQVNLRHKAIGDTALVGNNKVLSYGYVNTTFNRTGTDDASVTSTAFNEFSELVLSDDEVNTPFSVSVESNYDYKGTNDAVTEQIICPDVNGDGGNNDSGENINGKPIEFEFTYTNLPSSFTSFNNIGLHIHALNSKSLYQSSSDGVVRQWNIAVSVSTNGGTSYTDFGSLTDIDIANDITGSNKVWNIVKTGDDFEIAGSLKVKLTIQKGTTNMGCFFGLSNVILSAEGDTWYIEEMPDADKENIFHETKINSNIGLGSLMLGYTAKIPTGISAFYPATNQDLTDRHITFRSYGEPSDPVRLLPACTPAILKIADDADKSATYRFYYDANEVDDAADKATEDEKIIIEGSLYKKYVHVANTYGNRFGDGYSSNVYMYLSSSTTPKLSWVWYNYTAEGVNTGNNNTGGHVNVNANRAYIVMGKAVAKNIGSFSMRFDGGWTTDIEDIEDDYSQEEANEGAEGIFDLQGRKLDEITAPGIYIVNGEKVLVK